MDNPWSFVGYGPDCWGLTSSDGREGYRVHRPSMLPDDGTRDDGTIAPTAALKATHPELVSVFGYHGGYQSLTATAGDSMLPGQGYWIFLDGPALLDLSGAGAPVGKAVDRKRLAARPTGPVLWAESHGRRHELTLGVAPEDVVALPPVPPDGGFDMRVALARMESWQVPWSAAGACYQVHVQGDDVTLGWEIPADAAGHWELRITDQSYVLAGTQSLPLGADIPGIALRQHLESPLPQVFALAQNHPNPFNPVTTIRFSLPRSGEVELAVYSVMGQRVATLLHGPWAAGSHTVRWDGTDDSGRQLGSGVYLYRLISADQAETRKLILVR
jgi:hypothetical protein